MKKYLFIILLLFQPNVFAEEVNIYSARKQNLIKPLLLRFTEQTGIKVNLVTGEADTLIKRLEAEGRNSPADMLLTVDVARLTRASELGLFQPVKSELLNALIPANYRDADGQWYGLSLRSRIMVYAPERVSPGELSSYENLADAIWKNRVCVRSSSNVYNQSLVASLVAHLGEDKTEAWARDLVDNFARSPKGGDRDQIKAVAVGVCDVALVNTYYLAGMLESDQADQIELAHKVSLFWPNQAGRGTHMNVSGAGITKHAPNKTAAIKLLEFLAGDKAQQWYGETNHEFPVREGVATSAVLSGWGEFKADTLNLGKLGEFNARAVLLMDRAGWK